MAKGVFDPQQRYECFLYNHSFDRSGIPVTLPGYFEADTVEVEGELSRDREFAVFHVAEPQNREYPAQWVGVYRIPMAALTVCPPKAV